MQGLWSTHRRSKINLNAPISASAPGLPPSIPMTDPVETNALVEQQEPEASNSATAPQAQDIDPPVSDVRTSTTSGKRRLRRQAGEESNKRAKLFNASGSTAKDYSPPTMRLSDLGGVDACIEKMLELVAMPLCHPEIYIHTGVQPPRGVLLHGPPGCGKTLLAHAIAGVCCRLLGCCVGTEVSQELGVPFISISAPSVVSGMSGESEKTLRDTFEEAKVSIVVALRAFLVLDLCCRDSEWLLVFFSLMRLMQLRPSARVRREKWSAG